MASIAALCRASSRLAMRKLPRESCARGYRTSAPCLAAQNFTMPALSPTMTEGNIASWKVKEGDSFAAGDVLLEIETDKASMDVEAQDDGIMAKISLPDGSKGVKVGSRIGVLAEPGDDLATLEIPEEESAAPPAAKEESSKPDPAKTSESNTEKTPTSKQSDSASSDKPAPKKGKAKKQTYPLLPSVEHLIHEHGLDAAAIADMTPSGPNNRLLKGDVLAYLGSVSSEYPTELAGKISKLSHLDLSNVKLAPKKEAPKAAEAEAAPVVEDLEVAVPISLAAVLETQKKIESTLGVFLPLSTFIARATDVANEDLPRSKLVAATADELFDEVLGLRKVSSYTRGSFLPQIVALPPTAVATKPRYPASSKPVDVLDFLSGKKSSPMKRNIATPLPGSAATTNIFSVSVPKGDEKRAQVFLERVKLVLESEPGSLVL